MVLVCRQLQMIRSIHVVVTTSLFAAEMLLMPDAGNQNLILIQWSVVDEVDLGEHSG